MEDYIRLSTLGDFLYCPKSIYYHKIYDSYDSSVYGGKAQVV